jgi:8-oxo-dGTP pyrophosphatase MutT (NUDIX family)
MTKEMTVVFPIWKNEDDVFFVLMGQQAPGKRLAGIRNGYGGKREEGEEILDTAVREVKEEIDLNLDKEKLIYVGMVVEGDMKIYFYTYFLDEKISLLDNEEFVDNRWFELTKYAEYIHEMFPGNIRLMELVNNCLKNLNNFEPFILDESNNLALMEKAKKIYE